MSGLWWLILGLLAGWLVELAIDYRYWRRHTQAAAARVAQQEAALAARSVMLDERQAAVEQREAELSALQAAVNAKDAELLAQAKRVDERAEEVTRLEQAMDKRRADLDRMGLTLNEREKDISGRSNTLKANETVVATRSEKLSVAEADVTRRIAVVSNRESAMQNWEARILAREHEVGDQEAELVRKARTADQLVASLAAANQLLRRQYLTDDGQDNLEVIDGVDANIAELLREADIRTFERVAETSLGEFSRLMESGGSRLGLADPMTWAEQASLLFNGDYVGFEQLRAELAAGEGGLVEEVPSDAVQSGSGHSEGLQGADANVEGAKPDPDAADDEGTGIGPATGLSSHSTARSTPD